MHFPTATASCDLWSTVNNNWLVVVAEIGYPRRASKMDPLILNYHLSKD